jgi:hypothetical protein
MTEEQKSLIQRFNLKPGAYKIKKENGKFKIFQIKDDTLGCILVGERSKDNILVHSTPYEIKLVEILKNTQESITIKII